LLTDFAEYLGVNLVAKASMSASVRSDSGVILLPEVSAISLRNLTYRSADGRPARNLRNSLSWDTITDLLRWITHVSGRATREALKKGW
jgi:hypothetical protein